jgi:ribosomal protein S18 acetylase RimI-like enzyme
MTPADAAAVARLHTTALQGLLSDLGLGLATAFYRAAARLDATIAVVADEGGPVGFVCGTTEAAGYYHRVALASPLAVGGRLAWRLAADSELRRQLGQGEAFRGPELLFLAVAEEHRGLGIGGSLIDQFEDRLRDRRISRYALCVEADNSRARAVYEARGLVAEREFDEFGLARVRYIKTLPTA